jgi:hypothetical protein
LVLFGLLLVQGANAQVADTRASDARSVRGPPAPGRHPGQNGPLTDEQQRMAAAAWRYFENNFQASTCLYDSVDGYPSMTMWDAASELAALVSAFELGLIDADRFDARTTCFLATLDRLELYHGELPNKAYDTLTLGMVDYNDKPGPLGFSAIDVGRLLTWLAIVRERYPAHAEAVEHVVLGWTFCNAVDPTGTLFGAVNGDAGGIRYLQEGRLGYEEYAAKGYELWGFDTTAASREEPYEEIGLYGVPIAYDGRDPAKWGAHNYVATEAWLLQGIELNWDQVPDAGSSDDQTTDALARNLSTRVYRAQEARFKRTGILTARTEHQVDAAPYFVYDTLYSDGNAWTTISDDGKQWPDLAAVSAKAAIGMGVLFDTQYTDRLVESVLPLVDPEKGVHEGYREDGGQPFAALTANTNGIILETLLYKVEGKLYRAAPQPPAWEAGADASARCLPRPPLLAPAHSR